LLFLNSFYLNAVGVWSVVLTIFIFSSWSSFRLLLKKPLNSVPLSDCNIFGLVLASSNIELNSRNIAAFNGALNTLAQTFRLKQSTTFNIN
jgi:hypothetical protein